MAWQKNNTNTLLSANASCDLASLTTFIFNVLLNHKFYVGTTWDDTATFNEDATAVYSQRASFNGAADGTSVSRSNMLLGYNSGLANDEFVMGYFCDISGEEKLGIFFAIDRNTAGATTAPNRVEKVYKFTGSSITSMQTDITTGDTFDTGTNLTLLGTD